MSDTRWLTQEEQEIWRSFVGFVRLLGDQLDRELQRDAGMPHAYYVILSALSEAPDRTMRMSDLAEISWTSRSRLSHAIARMEEEGWVGRRSCPTDRRGSFAVLTDEGFSVLEAASRGHVEHVRRHLFDVLSREQVEQLGRISAAVAGTLAGKTGSGPVLACPGDGMVSPDAGTGRSTHRETAAAERH